MHPLPCSQAHVSPPSPCHSVEAGQSGIREETLEVDPHLQKAGNPTHEAWMASPTGTDRREVQMTTEIFQIHPSKT